jgi:hypothetical protein
MKIIGLTYRSQFKRIVSIDVIQGYFNEILGWYLQFGINHYLELPFPLGSNQRN